MLSVILAFWAVFGSQAEVVDRVVTVVNGEVITLSMVEDAMQTIRTDPQKATPASQRDALERLIDHKLKLQEARRLGVIVSEESLSREVAKVAARFASPKEFSVALQRLGITQKDLEESLIEDIMVQEMVDRKFRIFVEVAESEALDFFEQHRAEFVMPEAVHLDRVFFQLAPDADEAAKKAIKSEAEKVLEELKSDAEFSKYTSAEGMVDYIAVDQLLPIEAAAISQLKIGEISNLIETPVGYFIFRFNDRRSARQATFDEVKDEIKTRLIQQETDAELGAWLKKRRESADIRILVKFKD